MNGSVHQSGIDVGCVCDMCRFLLCHDFFDGVDIRVIEDDGIFVDVDFGRSSIVVENGRWYVSNFD